MEEIKQALQIEFGTLDALAKVIHVRNTAVYNWMARGQIPIRHIKKIVDLTEGRITIKMLRPDLFPKD
jgi:DNA-binding transcriptional regulator YdaS (Cro superfamily)